MFENAIPNETFISKIAHTQFKIFFYKINARLIRLKFELKAGFFHQLANIL